jgi:hypothetical protein
MSKHLQNIIQDQLPPDKMAIVIDYGRDKNGHWWWRANGYLHGPFPTEAAANENSELMLGGAGGMS